MLITYLIRRDWQLLHTAMCLAAPNCCDMTFDSPLGSKIIVIIAKHL